MTVTLPEETLERLAAIDGDRAKAIVRAAELAEATLGGGAPAVEMQAVSPRTAVITVPESPALASLRGLRLIQIRPSRYLIVLERGMALAEVEITLLDALEALPAGGSRDHTILSELLHSLRSSRRSERATTGELILVDI